jgi:hypothetical protein
MWVRDGNLVAREPKRLNHRRAKIENGSESRNASLREPCVGLAP